MDIVVKGRRADVSDRFREHVEIKLAKLERLDHKAFRVDVELSRERNPRLSGVRERVELTVFTRGPVIRAEAAAADAHAALDLATAKLMERMRRAADRRVKRHLPLPTGPDLSGAVAGTLEDLSAELPASVPSRVAAPVRPTPFPVPPPGLVEEPDSSPMVVREKMHAAPPMTLDDALSNMELVGHDFYLFRDATCGLPCVVYRRRGYDYGVIRLQSVDNAEVPGTPAHLPGLLGATVTR